MLARRTVLAFAAAALAGRAHAQGVPPPQAASFVQTFGNEMVGIVNGSGDLASKKARLRPVIDQAVDVEGIARFCLGVAARRATPQQLAEYGRLFHAVLINNITAKLGDYQGVQFQMGQARTLPDGTYVATVITRPNNPPANVQWVVEQANGQPRIVDVVAEGTSLRQTQRDDYRSFLGTHGDNVNALIEAMQRQTGG